MNTKYTLCSLAPGESGTVLSVGESQIKKRLTDVGLVAGTRVICVGKNPGDGMRAYLIKGAVIAIRLRDCADVEIQKEAAPNGTDQ